VVKGEGVIVGTIARERVLDMLQRRYDHQSAQVIFKRALSVVKLTEQEQYTGEQLVLIGKGLEKVGDRIESVLAELTALAGPAGAPPGGVSTAVSSGRGLPTAKRSDEGLMRSAQQEESAPSLASKTASADASDATATSADDLAGEEGEAESAESEQTEAPGDAKTGQGRRRRR
jgi:hypothetical protein